MHDSDNDHRHAVALFRYGLIAELVRLEPGAKGLYAQIETKAAGHYTIPGSSRTRVAAETIRDWLKHYRRGGFDALLPKPRADRGQSRSLPAQVVDVLLATKEGNPALSVQLVIREARKHTDVPEELPLPGATVHRLLARHGLMDKPRGDSSDSDRRRFAFRHAGQMWMSDIMHGAPSPRRCHRRYNRGLSMPGIPLRWPRDGPEQRSAIRYGIARAETAVTCRTLAG